jgi:glycogen debranching enzyme
VTSVPVAFPTASRPQAWAAGAPLLLLTTLLGLSPGRTDLRADLPHTVGHVAIRQQPDHSPLPPATATV